MARDVRAISPDTEAMVRHEALARLEDRAAEIEIAHTRVLVLGPDAVVEAAAPMVDMLVDLDDRLHDGGTFGDAEFRQLEQLTDEFARVTRRRMAGGWRRR